MTTKSGLDFANLVAITRSYRRFLGSEKIEMETLRSLVSLARQTGSAGNKQPLKYVLSTDSTTNAKIFATLKWAGMLADWDGPAPEERPSGYIVIGLDSELASQAGIDVGIVAQTMMLGASAVGLGGCMFLSFAAASLKEALEMPESIKPALVLALGKTVETVVLEPMPDNGTVNYWRDDKAVHHVPKRDLSELILREF